MSGVDLTDLDPKTDPSVLDIKISWRYFKSNAKTFMGFIFSGYAIAIAFQIIIVIVSIRIMEATYGGITLENYNSIENLLYIAIVPFLIFTFAYFGSVYGLAYDVLSSGEEFTRFSGSFYYFKKHGWQYVIIELVKSAPLTAFIILGITKPNMTEEDLFLGSNSWLGILIVVIAYLWLTCFVLATPSVTAHGSLKRAFRENFEILKKHKGRVFKSSLLFFLIFQVPLYGTIYVQNFILDTIQNPITLLILIMAVSLGTMIIGAIANPMLALYTTRIYNITGIGLKTKQEKKDQKREDSEIKIDRGF